mmetsp:Transcript_7099/g.15293  ORF Transcript_7099/g.15293 Transcript_7099/m.15293 type:complete len:255 (-) Transcript_7099:43-807(-)
MFQPSAQRAVFRRGVLPPSALSRYHMSPMALIQRKVSGGKQPEDESLTRWASPRAVWDRLVDWSVASAPKRLVSLAAKALFWPTLFYNRYRHAGKGGKTRWYDEVADGLILGAWPDASVARELAKQEGVTGVVNMVAESRGPQAVYSEFGIEELWVPIVDFTSPSVQDLELAVKWIQEHTQDGKRVYVHCKAGKGRSASVALAYLVATQGLTADEAQALLLKRRPQVLRSLSVRPEVMEFCRRRSLEGSQSTSG